MNMRNNQDSRAGNLGRWSQTTRPFLAAACVLMLWCASGSVQGESDQNAPASTQATPATQPVQSNTTPTSIPAVTPPIQAVKTASAPNANDAENQQEEELRRKALASIGKSEISAAKPAEKLELPKPAVQTAPASSGSSPAAPASANIKAPVVPSTPGSGNLTLTKSTESPPQDNPPPPPPPATTLPRRVMKSTVGGTAAPENMIKPGEGLTPAVVPTAPRSPISPPHSETLVRPRGLSTPPTKGVLPRPEPAMPGRAKTPVTPTIPARPVLSGQPVTPPPAEPSAGQEEGATATPPVTQTTTTMKVIDLDATPVSAESRVYRFDYSKTPWADVLADFSRMSGLSWLNEPDPPLMGEVTYRSPRDFTYQEAMHQLNELLLSRVLDKYLITRKENYLEIKRLPDLMREIPTNKMYGSFNDMEAAKPDEFELVIVYIEVPKGWTGYEIIETFRPMFSDTYGTQVKGDRIELTGLVREHRRWRSVIERMISIGDELPPSDDPRITITIPLKSTRAADIQLMLRQLFPVTAGAAPGARGVGPGVDQKTEKAKQVDIIPDTKNNTLIIKASRRQAAEIAEMVEKLDTGVAQKPPITKIIKLEYTDANALSAVLKPLFQQQKAALVKPGPGGQPFVPREVDAMMDRDIFPDPVSNSVVLLGSEEGVADAERIVKERDVPNENVVTEIIELKHAKADALAGTLSTLMRPMGGPGRPGAVAGPALQIIARTTNTLLVTCGKRDMDELKKLVTQLDVPPTDEAKEHLVKLDAAKPSMLVPILQQLFADGPMGPGVPRGVPPGGNVAVQAPAAMAGSSRARFIPIDATGYLIVYCTDAEWQRAESLIQQLDQQQQGNMPVLRTFTLKNADAGTIATMLQGMFPPTPPQPGQTAVREQIYADSYNNTVNVFADTDFIAKIGPLVEALDIQTKEPPTVIHLQNARADEVAPILQSIFSGGRGGGAMPMAAPGAPGQPPTARPMAGGAGATSVAILAEPITNSLLVSAPKKELEQIQKLVQEMEARVEIKRVILVPQNRAANEVAETLRSLVASAPRGRVGRGPAGVPGAPPAAVAAIGGALNITPDGTRILVEGPTEEVAKVIEYFDIVDVMDQEPMLKKYSVSDPEDCERKLRAMLSMTRGGGAGPRSAAVAAPPGAPGQPGAAGPVAAARPITPGSIMTYPDTYEGTLMIRAMPRDFVEIEKLLAQILAEAEEPPSLAKKDSGEEAGKKEAFPFFTYRLKHKKVFDVAWTLEDLINPSGSKVKIKIDEGPDEYTMLVRDCPPAKKELVLEYIKMWDVPSSDAGDSDLMMIETDKLPPEQIIRLIQTRWSNPNNRPIQVMDMGPSSRVQIVDIHEGEEELPSPSGNSTLPRTTTAPARPCVLPASLLLQLPTLANGQLVQPNKPRAPVGPAACPVCGKNPCVLAEHQQNVVTLSTKTTPKADSPAQASGVATKPVSAGTPSAPSLTPSKPVKPEAVEVDEARPSNTEGKVRLYIDPFTGKLMIDAPEEDRDLLKDWIEDVTGGKSPTVYRIFKLRYADVNSATQLLNNIFNQSSGGAVRQPRQPRQQAGQPQAGQQPGQPPQPQMPPQAQPQTAAESSGRIRVIPDARTRSLWVAAPMSDIPLIVDVLRNVDTKIPPPIGSVRIFRLKSLDAALVVQNLREILGLGGGRRGGMVVQPGQQPGQPPQPGQPEQPQQVIQMPGQQGVVVSSEDIKLTAVSQTNSIIAQAPPDTLELIESLIADLEEQPDTTKPEMRRITLQHARAADVANIVKDVATKVVSGAGAAPGGPMGRGGRGSVQVSVNADARTNSVILAGPAAELDTVEKIVKDLDVNDGGGSNIRQFEVKGDPQSIGNAIKSLFVTAGPQQDIVVTSDAASNRVIVKAPPQLMPEIEKQITEMDSKIAGSKQPRLMTIKFADAESVAQNLQAVFTGARGRQGGRQEITFKGFKSSNLLIVTGADDETFQDISTMVAQLDMPPTGMQVKAFPLKHASAVAVNDQLTQMLLKAGTSGGLAGVKMDLVGVVPDTRTNSLIVTGGPITFSLIDRVLTEVDKEATELAREPRTYQMPQTVNASDVAANITALFSGQEARKTGMEPPSVAANNMANLVIVVANATQHEQIQKSVIEPLTSKIGSPMEDYQIPLKEARADEIKTTLQEFMNNWQKSRGNKPQDACTITADINSGMLLVNCTPEAKAVLDKQLTMLDKPSKTTLKTTRFIKLTNSRADEIQRPLTEALQAKTSADPRGRWPFTIVADVSTNSLMITATDEWQEEIEKQVAQMDKFGDSVRKEYVIDLKNSNPNDVANSAQAILDAQSRGRRNQTSATIKAVPGTTKIIAFASASEYEQIKGLVEQIDTGSGGRVVHPVIMPELISAKSVAEVVNKMFTSPGGGRGSDGPRAEFHEPTNTLLVYATEAEFEKIDRQVIQTVCKSPAVGEMKIYKVPLKYAVAEDVAKILQDFFDKKSGTSNRRALPPWRYDSVEKQMENQIAITAEPTSNMLILYCTDTTKAMIDDLLKDIDADEPVGGKKIMELVVLQHMDANEMLGILTEYLKVNKRPNPEGEDYYDDYNPWWMRGGGGGRRQQQQQSQQEDKIVLAGDMRLRVVESMNAISVVGRPEAVQDAVAKIKEYDVENPQGTDVPQTLTLTHARATELAETLNKMFNDQARNKSRGASYVPPTITAVEATNSILVRAKPSDLNMIRGLLEKLDAQIGESGATGVQLLSVPVGRDVEDLARSVEDVINKAEDAKKEQNRDYRTSKVKINADPISNTLLVAGNKAQYDEVKRLVDDLVTRGPVGGRERRVIQLQNISPEKAKQIIEQMQQSGKGGTSTGSSARRPRSDAAWTKHHRWDTAEQASGSTGNAASCAGTIQGFYAQVACYAALGQTVTTQPTKPATPIKTGKIRPQAPAAQPQPDPAKPAEKPPVPSPVKPVTPGDVKPKAPLVPLAKPVQTPEEQSPAKVPGVGDIANVSPVAQEAFQKLLNGAQVQIGPSQPTTMPGATTGKRLSGSPVDVTAAGATGLIIECSPEDFDVIESILQMVDKAVPAKKIDYVKLKNSRAADQAKTLTEVFKQIEQVSRDKPTGPEDKVDIIADARTNGLYIAATETKMAVAMNLVAKADAEIPIEQNVFTYRFTNRRVAEAGPVLQKMISSYLKQTGMPADSITIEADPQNNQVFITGGESHLNFAKKLLEGLDAELPDESAQEGEKGKRSMQEADIMVVPLRVATAEKLGKLLSELMQKAASGDTPMKDFIRRMRILDEKGEPIAQLDLNKPMAIFGDAESNSLIIASSKDNCLIVRDIARAFDKEPSRAEVVQEVINLQFADATEAAQQLSDLLKESENLTKRPGGKGESFGRPEGEAGSLVYQAVIKADPRTNQLMIVGRPDSVAVLKGVVTRLDVKGLDVMPFEIIHLEYASASSLEEALMSLMKDRADALPKGKGENAGKAEQVIIKGDPRSRSLIVAARSARMEEIRGLIKKLDIPSTALIEDIRTITLKNGTATDLSDKLKKLWEERQKQQEAGSKGLKLEVPAIVADERSNSLIIAASKADYDAIKAVVDKIEALELNPMANIYIVRMKYNSAKQLSGPLKNLFDKRAEMRTVDGKVRPEDKVSIEADEVTNSLLVAASRENVDVLIQKVTELDQEVGVPGEVEFFECTNVGASRVKDTIETLFKDGVYKSGGKGEGKIAQDREKVTITIDDRSNILIVSASPENMTLAREIYKRMNSVTTPWDAAITRLITVEHGDAVKISAQVQNYFEELDKIRSEGSDSKSKSGFKITVFADERSNRIVVGGTKDGIDSAVEMIKKLDVEPGKPTQEVRVYTLREAPASTIKDIIDKVFQARNEPRQGAKGTQVPNVKVTIESRDASNSLVINASGEDHSLIADLISRIDRPSTIMEMVRVFPLERAPVERVKEILEELYKTGGADAKGGKSIGVVADKRTNAVVVAAPPGELENIGSLIKRLDETEVKGQAEIGVFTCDNEDAKKMSELLNEIMTGKAAAGGGGGGTADKEIREISSMLISFSARDQQGRDLLLKTIRENVSITYSERTNSVIVVAPSSSLQLIEQLVRKLDRIEKRPVLVKVFHLVNADATKMIDLLEKMLADKQGSEQQKQFQEGREFQVEGGISASGGVPSAASQTGQIIKGTFGRPKTTFVADERTNSIIAAGWQEDVDVIADILDQLDSQPIQDRENVVVTLSNKKVEEVQQALDKYFQAEQQRLDRLKDSVSPQRRMDQEVTVVAHKESNQLIVSASPRYKPQVLATIEQLDLPPPEVMIQVMIAEVALDDRFQMGLEFAMQELRFSETAVPGGNGVLQSSHFDVVGGTDLGAAGTGLAGFSFTITGEDFNFLVRALQSDSRLEVIQRPMLMCQDNQKASIDLGQKVPFIRGTQSTGGGQVNSTVEYEQIGIKLEIEPTINPDGFVYLHLVQEISSISDSSINIGNGVLAPVFNSRKADTWIAVKDEETLVIGGLITTSDSESETKVPFLGDIPGLGMLFRTTSRTKLKTELLIALTPRIVRTVEDGRRLSVESRDKSKIITTEMKQSPMLGKLQVTPETMEGGYDLEMTTPPGTEPTWPEAPPEKNLPPAPEKKYGPEAPRYGPQVPDDDEDVVAQRRRETITAGSVR